MQSFTRKIRGRRLLTLWVCFVVCGTVLVRGTDLLSASVLVKILYLLLVLISAILTVLFYRSDMKDDLPGISPNYIGLSIPPVLFRIAFVLAALHVPSGVARLRLTSPFSMIGLAVNLIWLWLFYRADLSFTVLQRQQSGPRSSQT